MKLPTAKIDWFFPREITSLHQIEITSRCNLRCVYCPSPNLKRPKVDMNRSTFERALEWAAFYVNKGSQSELNLAGIGESTIHPDFIQYLELARSAMGWGVKIIFATNGLEIARRPELAQEMAPFKPAVWVSLHRPEKGGMAVQHLQAQGILEGVSIDPSLNANEWAGQVKWKTDNPGGMACQWLRGGKIMAMADGRLTTCCLDASGIGVIGDVKDEIGSVETRPYDLCKTCHQTIGVAHWDQVRGKWEDELE